VELLVADSRLTRLVGLAGRRSLPRGRALVFPRCRSVHTFGMRFALDLVWLAGEKPVRIDRGVRPGRVRSCRAADAVVEANAGEAGAVVAELKRARPPARPGESPAP